MTKQLPPKPNLENLAKQAKNILKSHKNKDKAVCARLKALNRFAKASDTEILGADLNLADVQFVLAMEYGYKSWSEMKKEVLSMEHGKKFEKLDDLLGLNNRSIEVLLRDIELNDLATLLTKISPELYGRIWKNMAQGRRDNVMKEWKEMRAIPPLNIEKVHDKILGIANKLADELVSDSGPEGENTMNPWETELGTELEKKPADQRTAGELAPIFVELAKVARREGLIAMYGFSEKHVSDELMKLGLRMTIDGTDVSEIKSILMAKKTTMVQAYERRLEMIIAGVEGIGTGLNPALMEEKCKAFWG